MFDEKQLIERSKHFIVVNEFESSQQISDLTIDYLLKYIMFGATISMISSRFNWAFYDLENFVIFMPLPDSSERISLIFHVDWNFGKYYLTDIFVGAYKLDYFRSCEFVRELYSNLRPMWEHQKQINLTAPLPPPQSGSGCCISLIALVVFYFL
jgi:hypothetical protein